MFFEFIGDLFFTINEQWLLTPFWDLPSYSSITEFTLSANGGSYFDLMDSL